MPSLRRLLVVTATLALAFPGCGGGTTTYVTLRHPLQVGAVDQNQVPFESMHDERLRALPLGTLVDRAQLLSLTPDRICVQVSLWADQLRPQRADFAAYRIALLSDQQGVENTSGQIQMGQATMAQFQGVRRHTRYNGGYSVRRVAMPFVWQITQQPATLCFQNGGFVTPATRHLTLELSDAGAGNRINFEWEFNSSVAGTQHQ